MRTFLVLFLIAFPAFAADEPTWTDEEVMTLAQKLDARREAERDAAESRIREQEDEIKELHRKLEAMRGKYVCT